MQNKLLKKLWAKMLPWFIAMFVMLTMSISLNIVAMTYIFK